MIFIYSLVKPSLFDMCSDQSKNHTLGQQHLSDSEFWSQWETRLRNGLRVQLVFN